MTLHLTRVTAPDDNPTIDRVGRFRITTTRQEISQNSPQDRWKLVVTGPGDEVALGFDSESDVHHFITGLAPILHAISCAESEVQP